MKALLLMMLIAISTVSLAQVAITNDATLPDPSAMLDVKSLTRGLLMPRMTMAQRNAITGPANGLIIYQTDNTPGYYYNAGTSVSTNWAKLLIGSDAGVGLTLPYYGSANSTLAFYVTNQQGIAIEGQVTATSGAGTGVFGESYSSDGRGVAGHATCTTATAYGVYGSTVSPYGAGVAGVAGNSAGYTNGVSGTSHGSNGAGVAGENLSMTGSTYGVRGHVNSPTGYSGYFTGPKFYVSGNLGIGTETPGAPLEVNGQVKITGGSPGAGKVLTSDATGLGAWQSPSSSLILPYEGVASVNGAAFRIVNMDVANAIYGVSTAVSGIGVIGESYNYGVYGKATYSAGPNWGVSGESASTEGRGVYGKVTSSSGYSIGVLGESASTTGTGVSGYVPSATGNTYGVRGVVGSSTGIGVYGYGSKGMYGESTTGVGVYADATSTTGTNYGLYANTSSSTGIGSYGRASSSTGANFGIYGFTLSSAGTAVYGLANSLIGTTAAIKGEVNSVDGFSGWFGGGKFYVNGRVGLGTTAPGAGLHLKATGFPNSFLFIEAADANDAGIRLYEGTAAQWHIFNSSSLDGFQIYNNAGSTAFFAKQSNSYVGIGMTSPTYQLHVGGEAAKTTGTTAWVISSDIRLKNILGNYSKGLNEIAALQPVRFMYKPDNPRRLPSGAEQVGFVAQEVQKIFPEAVTNAQDGYLDFNIHAINVAVVNAIKELKAENDRLKAANEQLRNDYKALNTRLEKLEKHNQ